MRSLAWIAVLVCTITASSRATAQSADDSHVRGLVRQNLLGLVHAPEVHQELGLSETQITQLEALFEEIDGEWFRARIRPADEQFQTIAKLEARVRGWFKQHTNPQSVARLDQLELQSLGIRMLLRPDVAQTIGLDASQHKQLVSLAQKVEAASAELQKATMQNKVTEPLKKRVADAMGAESEALKTVVKPAQLQQLVKLVGETFDTSGLSRIYPKAPEFIAVDNWINSKPLSLKELRGKVVVVHYYAFQCHNCHANFGHYQKWHQEFPDEVVVIGIQTPETTAERDAAQVRAAAEQKGMEYPVLIDLDSENWAAWANTMWPTVYVIDKDGYLRHWWQGELNWQGATGDKTIHDLIVQLIDEK
ncbi:MAG: redoxin domain-containing protein [Pirellulaceae bacterium]